jgi:hypothetical protein
MSNLEHRRSVFRKAVAADNVLSTRFRNRGFRASACR